MQSQLSMIKLRRLQRGYTQTWLADRIGISVGHLSNIERGKYKPTMFMLSCIAKALNVSMDDLCDDPDKI